MRVFTYEREIGGRILLVAPVSTFDYDKRGAYQGVLEGGTETAALFRPGLDSRARVSRHAFAVVGRDARHVAYLSGSRHC